jgi:hypothetical protein
VGLAADGAVLLWRNRCQPEPMNRQIELVARREAMSSGYPNYGVFAGEQRVGRIYQMYTVGGRERWFWGLNTITDMKFDVLTEGHADSFADARTNLRVAFDQWLERAFAMPRSNMKYPRITIELKKMGAV